MDESLAPFKCLMYIATKFGFCLDPNDGFNIISIHINLTTLCLN